MVRNGWKALFFSEVESGYMCWWAGVEAGQAHTVSITNTARNPSTHRPLGRGADTLFGTVLGYQLVLTVEFTSLGFKRNTPVPLRSLL